MSDILLPVYDFDGNVLSPWTMTFFKEKATGDIVSVLACEVDQNPDLYYKSGKYTFVNDSPEDSFQRFRDYYPHNAHPGPDGLIYDTQLALKEATFPPSFESFKQLALVQAEMFAILTARGHGSDNIQRAIQIIAQETLTDDEKKDQIEHIKQKYYHLLQGQNISNDRIQQWFFDHIPTYMGVNNTNFCKNTGINRYDSTPSKKSQAIDIHFRRAEQLHGADSTFAKGFSDDSVSNIVSMGRKFLTEKDIRPQDKYRLYFTGKYGSRDEVKAQLNNMDMTQTICYEDHDDILKIDIHN